MRKKMKTISNKEYNRTCQRIQSWQQLNCLNYYSTNEHIVYGDLTPTNTAHMTHDLFENQCQCSLEKHAPLSCGKCGTEKNEVHEIEDYMCDCGGEFHHHYCPCYRFDQLTAKIDLMDAVFINFSNVIQRPEVTTHKKDITTYNKLLLLSMNTITMQVKELLDEMSYHVEFLYECYLEEQRTEMEEKQQNIQNELQDVRLFIMKM